MRLKENEMIEQFRQEFEMKPGQIIDDSKYAPLIIKSIEREVVLTGSRADAIIEFCIADGPCFKALVEVTNVATPMIISSAVLQLKSSLQKMNDKTIMPFIVVPYMGAEQAKILQKEGISWIDLCGNMMIKVSGKIYIERTGKKNQFPDTSPIKKIFEGTSSLVSRALLLKKASFKTLFEIVDFINQRGGNITLGTVSKVISSLEEELLITKIESGIVVNNREKLLEKLLEGYKNYTERNENKTFTFASDIPNYDLPNVFFFQKVDYAMCGFYAAQLKGLAMTKRITIFIKSINEARKAFESMRINIKPDTEFGQLDLIETRNSCVWFDLQKSRDYSIVDEIELYLEMMIDTPRGPKIAEVLKERILKGKE